MRGNILGVFFTILCGVLIALIVIAYGRSDRIAPEFRFSAVDLIYDSETKDDDLKVGINAYDAKDGDLTSRIVVEKVVLNRDAETAVVYYAVADYSGNVTKQSRVFPADIADIDSLSDASETAEEPAFPFIVQPEGEEMTGEAEPALGEQQDGTDSTNNTDTGSGTENQEP